jgi:hypothetical protein
MYTRVRCLLLSPLQIIGLPKKGRKNNVAFHSPFKRGVGEGGRKGGREHSSHPSSHQNPKVKEGSGYVSRRQINYGFNGYGFTTLPKRYTSVIIFLAPILNFILFYS